MRVALLISCALLVASAPRQLEGAEVPDWLAGELSLSAGVDFTDGDYGGRDGSTQTLFVPFTFAYLFDRFAPTEYANDLFELRLTIPWVSVDGPGLPELGTLGGIVVPDLHRNGIGDVNLGATYLVFPPTGSALPALELSGRVKFPTAPNRDDHLLGTGVFTYTLQADLYRSFGRFTPLLTIGYRLADEHTRRFRLRNTPFTSVGGSLRIARWLSVGMLHDWSGQTSGFSNDTHEIFPYAVWKLRDDLRLMPYGLVGLSTHAPDWGVGFQLRFTVPVR